MERYVAFLRGMNLGSRRIKNDELRRAFEDLGLADVACFRASGNVVFAADGGAVGALTSQIEAGLGKALGYEVPVFLRDAAELREIATKEPFAATDVVASQGKLQIAFLVAVPTSAARKKALALATEEDRLAVDGRQLYWLPSGGISESELDLATLESTLGPWTMRTKNTVEQISRRHLAA